MARPSCRAPIVNRVGAGVDIQRATFGIDPGVVVNASCNETLSSDSLSTVVRDVCTLQCATVQSYLVGNIGVPDVRKLQHTVAVGGAHNAHVQDCPRNDERSIVGHQLGGGTVKIDGCGDRAMSV